MAAAGILVAFPNWRSSAIGALLAVAVILLVFVTRRLKAAAAQKLRETG